MSPDERDRLAKLEARHEELSAAFVSHADADEDRMVKIWEAINGLRADIFAAKGGGKVALMAGGLMVLLIAAGWQIYTTFRGMK